VADHKHFISIWLFIGILLLIYGALILGSGIYELFSPPKHPTVLNNLHPQLWWGGLMLALGAVYTWLFRPKRER
jgi:hypothetical protein